MALAKSGNSQVLPVGAFRSIMPKQSPKKTVKRAKARPGAALAKALAKQSKPKLIELILSLACEDVGLLRRLELQFNVETPLRELVAATQSAISDATNFDDRDYNRNFDYDYAAYEAIERNLTRLVQMGKLREAMRLCLDLMKQGSYQVEASDEGLMTDDIEECLQVVIKALAKSDLAAKDVVAWCDAMTRMDRVGFICDTELEALRNKRVY